MEVDLGIFVFAVALALLFVGGKQVAADICDNEQFLCPPPQECCTTSTSGCCSPRPTPSSPRPPFHQSPPGQPPHGQPPAGYVITLNLWTNWYFWVLFVLLLVSCFGGCGYWRRRKIYESSSSQTPGLGHLGSYDLTTPSDDTPHFPVPYPFLPPAPYPAPPPYSEATRGSFDTPDQHLYEAMITGRTVYDFYDRRHPNAYYDRYFLPDDTSSSETTSLLSCHLQRSCSAHLSRHHSLRKCDIMAPPPYSEVTAKPDLYPVVMMRGVPETKGSKSLDGTVLCAPPLPALYHHYIYRSDSLLWTKCIRSAESVGWTRSQTGSVSTPEGSQASSSVAGAHNVQCGADCDSPRQLRPRAAVTSASSPAASSSLFQSCSELHSPASSIGQHVSEVSSLAPTTPMSPPAPTSPTLHAGPNPPPNFLALDTSPAEELREVLHKINQLPRAFTPGPSPDNVDSVLLPGGPQPSQGSKESQRRRMSQSSQTSWTPSPPLSLMEEDSSSPFPSYSRGFSPDPSARQQRQHYPPFRRRGPSITTTSQRRSLLYPSLSLDVPRPARPRTLPLSATSPDLPQALPQSKGRTSSPDEYLRHYPVSLARSTLPAFSSTPNLALGEETPSPPPPPPPIRGAVEGAACATAMLVASLVGGTRVVHRAAHHHPCSSARTCSSSGLRKAYRSTGRHRSVDCI